MPESDFPDVDLTHPLVAMTSFGISEAVERPVEVLPRDRSKADPATVSASQRWRLLRAVAHVVASEGYPQATIAKITAAAGVSRKTFYKFFASKEEAFLASWEGVDAVLARLSRIAAAQPDLEAVLHAVWSNYLVGLADTPDLTKLLLVESLAASPSIRRKRAETVERFARAFQEGIAELSNKDPRAVTPSGDEAVALLGGINELCVRHISRHPVASLPDITGQLVSFTRRYFGLTEPATQPSGAPRRTPNRTP